MAFSPSDRSVQRHGANRLPQTQRPLVHCSRWYQHNSDRNLNSSRRANVCSRNHHQWGQRRPRQHQHKSSHGSLRSNQPGQRRLCNSSHPCLSSHSQQPQLLHNSCKHRAPKFVFHRMSGRQEEQHRQGHRPLVVINPQWLSIGARKTGIRVGARLTVIGVNSQSAINAWHNAIGNQLTCMALSCCATFAAARAKAGSAGWLFVHVVLWSVSTAWQVGWVTQNVNQFGQQLHWQPPTLPPVTGPRAVRRPLVVGSLNQLRLTLRGPADDCCFDGPTAPGRIGRCQASTTGLASTQQPAATSTTTCSNYASSSSISSKNTNSITPTASLQERLGDDRCFCANGSVITAGERFSSSGSLH